MAAWKQACAKPVKVGVSVRRESVRWLWSECRDTDELANERCVSLWMSKEALMKVHVGLQARPRRNAAKQGPTAMYGWIGHTER